MMKLYRQEAANLRMTLIAGIVSVDDVVQWAESRIASLDEYDDELTDLFLASKTTPQDVEPMLRRLGQDADQNDAIRFLMGRMHRALLENRSRARDFARLLDRLWIENRNTISEDLNFMAGVDDDFCLAEQGTYGTIDGAIDYLIEQTKQFNNNSEPTDAASAIRGP